MKNRKIISFSIAFVVTLLFLSGGYYLLNTSFLQQKPTGDANGVVTQPDDTLGESSAPPKVDEVVNFLLCGLDESQTLTDVIMVASLDTAQKTVNVFQIPRDTYVGISRYPTGKINAVYGNANKGQTPIGALIDEVQYTFELHIDHYATVNLQGLRQIVDSMGGVTVDIPQNIYFTSSKVLKKGEQLLDGQKAEWFVRYRAGYVDGDIGRMRAQGLFLKACAQTALSMSRTKMLTVLTQNYTSITTDLTLAQVMEYYSMVKEIDIDSVEFYLPEGSGVTHQSYSVYALNKQKTADLLNEHFRPYSDDVPAQELPILKPE